MASTRLTRTQSSDTYNYNFTFSFWMKKSSTGATSCILATQTGSDEFRVEFDSSDRLFWYKYDGSFQWNLYTERNFRDTNAWYHFVLQYDSTQATASNRLKMYVNGVQETDFQSGYENYPSQNENSFAFQGGTAYIGCNENTNAHFDGILSHINMVHGTTPAYTSFGSTDSTTGEWKINTSPSVTYGSQGYFILKDGNSVTDQSGNSNNWTVANGTLTNTEDCPSNNFATWNNLCQRQIADKGATEITPNGDADYAYSVSTLGASTGKYYFEFNSSGGNGRALIGMVNSDYAGQHIADNAEPGGNAYSFAYRQNQGDIQLNNSTSSYGTQVTWGTSNNVLMMAVDLDNNKVWYGVDGTWQNSGDPANGTNGFDWSAVRTAGEDYLLLAGDDTSSGYGNIQANFGNGYFGTDAISSEGTNASGIGKFEYDVPTGYTALSTKGLNE